MLLKESPEKWGKYTIGSGIKIISEKEARKFKPDYFLVLPYGFINEFIEREKTWLKNGGKFILPYPKFRVISR
jgi:NDP-4-keto-2,6-dideoxyhexose 3-C-methyltransferase